MRQRAEVTLNSSKETDLTPAAGQKSKYESHTCHDDDSEDIRQRIERVSADISDIDQFYNIASSPTRHSRFHSYYTSELSSLKNVPFNSLNQEGKIDYLLLQNHLKKDLHRLSLEDEKNEKTRPLMPFAEKIVGLCEDRQKKKSMDGKEAAQALFEAGKSILETKWKVESGKIKIEKSSAFRAARLLEKLQVHLDEWYKFYKGYDPLFSWWVPEPYEKTQKSIEELVIIIKEKLVGIGKDDKDAIVGDPIGREGLLADLDSEMIPYTPEELIEIGEKEYTWCEAEMKKASKELGYGEKWRDALEYVKTLYVPPGKQTELVRDLSQEVIDHVTKYDLVTVPPIAAECWRMYMITPEAQRANPFFLGGTFMQVAYPTNTMDHEWKMMSMRGNNIHFSRSTVFHELIPGHHLQYHYMARHRPYRRLFWTPFSIEGWALYWEMLLWDDEKFPKTTENRIGMLFWRMHRCARIIFSVKFHLREMTPQECIDFLVEKVGHERSTAEGEVRRSFSGGYSPLYQAGYMLGALQLYALRREIVSEGKMTEKQYHDRVLKAGPMQIEFLRALIKNEKVSRDFETRWRFYEER